MMKGNLLALLIHVDQNEVMILKSVQELDTKDKKLML